MKNSVFFALLFAGSLLAKAQSPYISCDFSEGIPNDFILLDVDRLTPSPDMRELGFEVGIPWLPFVDDDGNKAVASTSWYADSGRSDDRLITKPFRVDSSDAAVSWRAKAHDASYPDGYSVYVVDADCDYGASLAAFTPAFHTDGEDAEWAVRSFSLAPWMDKEVRLIFVNDSYDCSRLYLDDIFADVKSRFSLSVDTPSLTDKAGLTTVSGKISTPLQLSLKGFKVGLSVAGQPDVVLDYPDVTVTPDHDLEFSFTDALDISFNTCTDYEVWAELDGERYAVAKQIAAFRHRILVEESSGTWCAWCVRGIVAMDQMQELYPDNFAGVVVHSGTDVMKVDEYQAAIDEINPGGLPKCIINRRKDFRCDPLNLAKYMSGLVLQPVEMGFDISATVDNELNSRIDVDLYFGRNIPTNNYRLGFILTEDEVYHPGDRKYSQSNAYSGGDMPMGGYENKGRVVPADEMHYKDVARGFVGDFNGFENVLPEEIKAFQPYHFTHTFRLPDNYDNIDNLRLTALLINEDGSVVNSDYCHFRKYDSVASVTDGNRAEITFDGNMIYVSSPDKVTCSLLDMQGCKVAEFGRALDVSAIRGIFILRVASPKGVTVRKIAL